MPVKKCFLLLSLFFLSVSGTAAATKNLIVGTYDYFPIVFLDKSGNPAGLYVDIIKEIAAKNNWHLTFANGTWQENLEWLKTGKIDLVLCIAHMPPRTAVFDLNNETVISTWGQIYTLNGRQINTILDLDKKKVAGLKGDLTFNEIKSMAKKFGVSPVFVECDTITQVFERIKNREVSAGVCERIAGLVNESNYPVSRTSIIFMPLNYGFAAAKGKNRQVLDAIDEYLKEGKTDEHSGYQRAINKWINGYNAGRFFVYIKYGLYISLILLAAALGINLFLRTQVKRRTAELNRQNQALKHEIEEKIKVEKALTESESKARAIFDISFGMVGLLSPDGLLIEANKTALDFAGVKPDDVIGRPFWETAWWKHNSETRSMLRGAVIKAANGQLERFEAEMTGADGMVHIIDLTLKPVFDNAGKVIYLIPEGRDITEIKAKENEMAQARQFSEDIINSLPGIFYMYDENSILVRWNKLHEQILGYSAEELKGKPVLSFYEGDEVLKIKSAVEKVWKYGKADAEAYITCKDGKKIPFYLIGSGITLLGKPYFIGVGVDISEAKNANIKLEKTIAQLEWSNAELERFIHAFSHELKNPIVTLGGFSGLLKRSIMENNIQNALYALDYISSSSVELNQLLKDLLEISNIGRVIKPIGKNSVKKIIQEAISSVADEIKKHNVNIIISERFNNADFPGGIIIADRERLVEVYRNLIINAVKYMGGQPEPMIEIGVRENDGIYEYYVKDNGIGLEKAYFDKIFGLFERISSTTEGTGAGLAIAKRIIELHNGKIWVESDGPGRGSTFYFTLKLKEQYNP